MVFTPGQPGPSQDLGQKLVAIMESQRGKPYIWGGNGPSGYDCSGLVVWGLKQLGITGLPRTSQAMRNIGQQVSLSNIAIGDLVTFTYLDRRGDNPGPGNHVAVYAGQGKVIQASGDRVNVGPLDTGHIDRIIRLPALGAATAADMSGSVSPGSTSSATQYTSSGTVTPATLRQAGYQANQAMDPFGIPLNPFDLPGFLWNLATGNVAGAAGSAGAPWDGLVKAALAAVLVAGGVALVVVGGGIAVWPTAQKGLDTAAKISTASKG